MADAAIERFINERLPGESETARKRRVAILRVVHAAENAERAIEMLGACVACYVQDPEDIEARAYAWRTWVEAEALAVELEALAREIRKSHATLKELAGVGF